ncbi:MAG TPA: T9SS type A sorting domain-containing protein, partial [Paludibacter sp.]
EVLPTATDMKAIKVGTDINLTWKDNATNELGYWIYRAVKISDTEFLGSTKIGEVAANVSSFTDTTVSVTNKKNYVYSVVAYSQLGLSLESDKAEIVLTGLNELNVPDFKVYQNPAEKTLMVTADNEISSIALYDLTGRTITSVAPNAKTSKLSLNNFMNGIYVLRVKMGNIVYNRKILITK